MRAWPAAVVTVVAIIGGLPGCSSAASTADLRVGDCVSLGGTADRPQATKAACGSPSSTFRVAATVADREQCPADVDSSYSMHNAFSASSNTVCLDIDWVVGGCMSVDPTHDTDPLRVDCNDTSATHRQRATRILRDFKDDVKAPVTVAQCASHLGYAYAEQRFVVCVEDLA